MEGEEKDAVVVKNFDRLKMHATSADCGGNCDSVQEQANTN